MNCPCEQCLIKPACKNKKWETLVPQCSLVHKYIYRRTDLTSPNLYSRILKVKSIVDTHLWEVHYHAEYDKLYVTTKAPDD